MQRLKQFSAPVLVTLVMIALTGQCIGQRAEADDSFANELGVVAQSQSIADDPGKLVEATRKLQDAPASLLPELLYQMNDSGPTATNRLRAIASGLIRNNPPPLDWMKQYVTDRSHPAAARSLIFQTVSSEQNEWAAEFLLDATDDPAPTIRRIAIDAAIERAAMLESNDKDDAITLYRQALSRARHAKQLTSIASSLRELGETITTADAMSMIMRWQLIGPFDNVGGIGFDAQYPPQIQYAEQSDVDLAAQYQGKHEMVGWSEVTADKEGTVDLHQHFNQEKGATAYAFVKLHSDQALPAQVRLKSVTANKVWVNGERQMVNAISHSGTTVDQYIADFELQRGVNTILIKTFQNEQLQPWAQKWEFQCRVTDRSGKALDLQGDN